MARRNLLIAHSGGPSPTLNACLAGTIDACRESEEVGALWAARHGPAGLLTGEWFDLAAVTPEQSRALIGRPGSVIGTSRRALSDQDVDAVVQRLAAARVDTLLYVGGNGSMDAADRLADAAERAGGRISVLGLPNTVDNDVAGTDHTPGFGSAARFYALAVRDIGEDNRALPSPVTVVETIGRNVGWVTAATALARSADGEAPHLIYTPERPPEMERILDEVRGAVRRWGRAVVAVCEGLRDPRGEPFGADLDRVGDVRAELARNLAHTLARRISAGLGIRARAERPGLLGRSCSLAVAPADANESYRLGHAAVAAALDGATRAMLALDRPRPRARCEVALTPLEDVRGVERTMPTEWAPLGDSPLVSAYRDYLVPLAGEIPPFSPFEGLPISSARGMGPI